LAVAGDEVLSAAHRVDQVVRRAHAFERLVQPGAGDRVALVLRDVGREIGALGIADERAHAAAAEAQLVEEVGAHVAGGPGEEDRCHRARYGPGRPRDLIPQPGGARTRQEEGREH